MPTVRDAQHSADCCDLKIARLWIRLLTSRVLNDKSLTMIGFANICHMAALYQCTLRKR
jgi:hypothetical protein